jgi:RimJ/RimL family protein N-acetyltransferase
MFYGNALFLKPASLSDRRKIYHWLTSSDATPSMMGPPTYPEAPVPTWEEFCSDYTDSFFGNSRIQKGKLFLIMREGEEIGVVGYDQLDMKASHAILDIWLKAKKFCGHGYGPGALAILCTFLHKKYELTKFYICPSARNKRACAAFKKCGFEIFPMTREEFQEEFEISDAFEYNDNVVMKKVLLKDVHVELAA